MYKVQCKAALCYTRSYLTALSTAKMKENSTADYRLQLHALQVYMPGSSLGSISVLYKWRCLALCFAIDIKQKPFPRPLC